MERKKNTLDGCGCEFVASIYTQEKVKPLAKSSARYNPTNRELNKASSCFGAERGDARNDTHRVALAHAAVKSSALGARESLAPFEPFALCFPARAFLFPLVFGAKGAGDGTATWLYFRVERACSLARHSITIFAWLLSGEALASCSACTTIVSCKVCVILRFERARFADSALRTRRGELIAACAACAACTSSTTLNTKFATFIFI